MKFTLPNKTILKYELVDIQGDKGIFLVPAEILTQNGTTILEIEWWKAGEIKNVPTPLPIQIQTNPWEVVE